MKKGLNWVHDPVKEVLSQGNNWTCPTLAVCPCLAILSPCNPLGGGGGCPVVGCGGLICGALDGPRFS